MELSKRLYAVASLVTEGASVADIGTDHGYIPIYLLEHGISEHVIAMDINKGPLERAKAHINESGHAKRIETRLSDGFEALSEGEVETVIAAGMGGGLVIKILGDHPWKTKSIKEFILQPQSEIAKVRKYLYENGFTVVMEDMVEEDGKYYPMMKAVHGISEAYTETEYRYGKQLLEKRHPILLAYLKKEKEIKSRILEQLSSQNGLHVEERIVQLQTDLKWIDEALFVY